MKLSEVIRYVEQANELLEQYGYCARPKGKQTGLIPIFAVGLTGLPKDVVKRVAPLLADKDGEHNWSAASQEDLRKYLTTFQRHKDAILREVKYYLGQNTLVNVEGGLAETVKKLEACRRSSRC